MNTAAETPHKRVALVCTNFSMQSAFGLLIIALNSVRPGFETSADLFDLGEEDFLDGVEIMLAADFMKRATGSDLHLMF